MEEDIDAILARAEVVNTEDAVKNEAADGLLNAFNVATFKTSEDDAAFWNRLIPDAEKPKEGGEELGVRGARLRTMEAASKAEEEGGRKRGRLRLRSKVRPLSRVLIECPLLAVARMCDEAGWHALVFLVLNAARATITTNTGGFRLLPALPGYLATQPSIFNHPLAHPHPCAPPHTAWGRGGPGHRGGPGTP